jgi:hypothetical protein
MKHPDYFVALYTPLLRSYEINLLINLLIVSGEWGDEDSSKTLFSITYSH